MAAPIEKTIHDLNGKWTMDKQLSDDIDGMLAMQGIGWFIRKTLRLVTVTLAVKQYTDEADGMEHIDIDQSATGLSASSEQRTLDWKWRDRKDRIFGELAGRSRMCKLDEVEYDNETDAVFLKQNWENPSGDFMQSYVINNADGWVANQIWGFEEIQSKRYHTRHVVVRKGSDWKQARLVYDYQGSNTTAAKAAESENDGMAYGE